MHSSFDSYQYLVIGTQLTHGSTHLSASEHESAAMVYTIELAEDKLPTKRKMEDKKTISIGKI